MKTKKRPANLQPTVAFLMKLAPELKAALRAIAVRRGTSMSEVVRSAIRRLVKEELV